MIDVYADETRKRGWQKMTRRQVEHEIKKVGSEKEDIIDKENWNNAVYEIVKNKR